MQTVMVLVAREVSLLLEKYLFYHILLFPMCLKHCSCYINYDGAFEGLIHGDYAVMLT